MDFDDILAALDSDGGMQPTDEQLASALSDARELAAEAIANGDVEMAETVKPVIDRLSQEAEAREAASAEAQARLAELADELGVEIEDLDSDDVDDATDSDDHPDSDADDVDDAADDPEPAMSAADIMARLRAQVRSRPEPDPEPDPTPDYEMKGIGPASGEEMKSRADVAAAFHRNAKRLTGVGKEPIAQVTLNYATDRRLTESPDRNTGVLNNLLNPPEGATTAAICGPGDVDHSVPVCGQEGQPIWSGIPTLASTRGKLSYFQAVSADTGGVALWDGSSSKPCPEIDCETPVDCETEAISACLVVGNQESRFSPEVWDGALARLAIEFDRLTEQTHLADIDAASSPCTAIGGLGTAANAAATYRLARAYYEDVYRITDGSFTVIAPAALRHAGEVSLLSNTADGTTIDVSLGTEVFPGANVIWTADDGGASTCDAFDATVDVRIFPTGAFFGLDGGTIDLGTEIRDSVLNAANQRQAFMETFRKVCFRGCESLLYPVAIEDRCGCDAAA